MLQSQVGFFCSLFWLEVQSTSAPSSFSLHIVTVAASCWQHTGPAGTHKKGFCTHFLLPDHQDIIEGVKNKALTLPAETTGLEAPSWPQSLGCSEMQVVKDKLQFPGQRHCRCFAVG